MTKKLQEKIEEKKEKTMQLKFAINDYTCLKLKYMKLSNDYLLHTDFKEATGEARPTVAMKEAYIDSELFDLKTEVTIAKENINCIKRDIEILNDEIRLCEYQIKLELKE